MIKRIDINQSRGRSIIIWIIISLFFILTSSSFLIYISYNKYQDILILQRHIKTMTKKTAPLEEMYKVKNETLEYQKDLYKKHKKMNQLARLDKQAPVKLMNELSLLIPEKVMIESLALEKKDIIIKGTALSTQDIMLFLDKLDESTYFRQPGLLTLGVAPDQPVQELIPFTITAQRLQ